MSRVPLINPDHAPTDRREVLQQIHNAFGTTPNMFRAVANSPAALDSMWGFFAALGAGAIDARLAEKIAVAVAERNACDYCLAAHTALGRKAGASATEMSAAQLGESDDASTRAALQFALKLVNDRGQLDDGDLASLRLSGFGDGEIVEIIAHVALNVFTNTINVALKVPVDFPAVKLRRAA